MENPIFTQKEINNEVMVINPGKILDNNNAHKMVDTITELQNRGYKNIILNMDELEFLSSAGVGSILGTVEISRENGGDIILCNISDTILHILQVLDVAEYLTIMKSLRDVLKGSEAKV